mmetsp:Transcript_44627/g.100011  ORF Transcript_44627/g.100011 Transcript_44627/m.100011 type:complete len:299 (-) Transcript_44627:91-987(-)
MSLPSDESMKQEFRRQRDMCKEHWLRSFCEEETEHRQLLHWLIEEGLCRPQEYQDRVEHAHRMRKLANDWYHKDDFRRALHLNLGAIHAVDFTPQEQKDMTDGQRQTIARELLPILSNLAQVFLKRGDFGNVMKASHLGLRNVNKLPLEEGTPFKAKLRYRRALALAEPGPERNLEASLEDLQEASKLMPGSAEIRTCLRNCKRLLRKDLATDDKEAAGEGAEVLAEGPAADRCGQADVQLSPAMEMFAQFVGRSLARILRCWNSLRGKQRTSSRILISGCSITFSLFVLWMMVAVSQ